MSADEKRQVEGHFDRSEDPHGGALHIYDNTVHRHNVTLGGKAEGEAPSWSQYCLAVCLSFTLLTTQWCNALTAGQAVFISRDLGPNLAGWFGSTQLVAASATYPVWAFISDAIGRKPIIMLGTTIAFIGNLISSRADGAPQMIVGLVFIGIGAAAMSTLLVTMGDVVPVRTRAVFLGIVDIGGSISQATTTIVGGALTSKTSGGWRSNFYLLAGMNFAVFLLFFNFHPVIPHNRRTSQKSVAQVLLGLDWIGAFIATAGTVLTLVGFNQANTRPWGDSLVLGPMIVGLIIVFGIFPAWCYFAKDPIVKRSLFLFWNYSFALTQTFLSGFLLFAAPAFLPVILGAYYNAISALRVGVLTLCFSGGYLVTTAPATASVSWLKGSFRPLLAIGWLIGVGACAGLSTLSPTDPIGKWLGLSWILGMCSGITSGMGLVVTQYSVTHENLGIGVGLGNTTRAIAGSLAIALYFTVYAKRLAQAIPERVVPAALGAGLPASSLEGFIGALTGGNAAALEAIPGISPAIIQAGSTAYLNSIQYALRAIWYITLAFIICGFIATVLMHPIKFQRLTNDVPVRMGKFTPWGGRELRKQMEQEAAQAEKIHPTMGEIRDENPVVDHSTAV